MILGSVELYRVVHTSQRQITTQIPIEFCIHVVGLGLGHCQCDNTISLIQHDKDDKSVLSRNFTKTNVIVTARVRSTTGR